MWKRVSVRCENESQDHRSSSVRDFANALKCMFKDRKWIGRLDRFSEENQVEKEPVEKDELVRFRILHSSTIDVGEARMSLGRCSSCIQGASQIKRSSAESSTDDNKSRMRSCSIDSDHYNRDNLSKDDRLYIMEEVVEREKSYIDFLKLFITVIDENDDDEQSSVIQERMSELILAIARILVVHEEKLLPRFENAIDQWPSGPCFWDKLDCIGDCLDDYAFYFSNFEFLQTYLEPLILIDSVVGQHISQNILLPVQQLPRYRLHMNRYIRNLEHAQITAQIPMQEIDRIREIYSRLDVNIHYLNENVGPTLSEIVHLQERLRHQLIVIQSSRKLLKHGYILKLHSRSTQYSIRYVILCSDCFVVCTNVFQNSVRDSTDRDSLLKLADNSSPLKVRQRFDFSRNQVVYVGECREYDGSMIPGIEVSKTFRIWFPSRVMDFEASTEYEAQEWVRKLKDLSVANVVLLRGNQMPPREEIIGYRAPVWRRDHTAPSCTLCLKRFSVLNRRHHCRVCGEVICSYCSKNRLRLPYLAEDSSYSGPTSSTIAFHRICNRCYMNLSPNYLTLPIPIRPPRRTTSSANL